MSDPGEASPGRPSAHSTRYVRYVIFLLFVVNVFNYMDRLALAVLAPSIKVDLSLSDAQLGLLSGLAFALFYAICGIPIARWADRGIRRNIIALALAVWSAMTALSGAAQSFLHLFAARIGVGAGEAGGLPTAQSVLCDYVPLQRRAGVFSIYAFGIIVGMMVGMGLAGSLGETIGWRWTFVALGLPGIALAVVIRLTLREPVRGQFDAVKDEQAGASFTQTVAVLWRCRTYRLLVLFLTAMAFVQFGLNQWWPSFYARTFGLSLSSLGLYLAVALGAGSGSGLLIGGLLANKAAQRDVRLPLLIGAAATTLALPTALASLFVSSASASLVLVGITAMFWSVPDGSVVATLLSVVSSRMRATAGALTMFCQAVLGLSLGPLFVGVLSDTLSPLLGVEALRYALLLPVLLLPATAIALYGAAKTVTADLPGDGADEAGAALGDARNQAQLAFER